MGNDVNGITVTGRTRYAPTLSLTSEGVPICKLHLDVRESGGRFSMWLKVALFGALAMQAAKVEAGARVFVEGALCQRKNGNGERRYEVKARSFCVLVSNEDSEGAQLAGRLAGARDHVET